MGLPLPPPLTMMTLYRQGLSRVGKDAKDLVNHYFLIIDLISEFQKNPLLPVGEEKINNAQETLATNPKIQVISIY